MSNETETRKDFYAPVDQAPHEEGISDASGAVVVTAEINQQIATARRFPRSITQFRRDVFEMVTLDVDIAESCIYAFKRDGKMIVGPSIRFAEVLFSAWGNCRVSKGGLTIDDTFVRAEGIFLDLQKNAALKAETARRITTKEGRRFSDDMIIMTGNAAASIAMRNAILAGVPRAIWNDVLEEAKRVVGGNAQTFGTRRDRALKDLGIQGATEDMIFALLGIKGIEDLTTDHLIQLRGLHNAIKEGEMTVESAFALENNLKPGEVAPPRPRQSAFERPAEEKTNGKERDAAKEEPVETAATAKPAEETKPEPEERKPEETARASQAAGADAMDEFLADMIAELKTRNSIKEIVGTSDKEPVSFRDRVAINLEGDAVDKWIKACDEQMAAIKAAFKAKK